MTAPLLAAADLRVDAHGIAVVDGLAFETAASRVIVLGAARALFEAASGIVRPSRGTIETGGAACARALAANAIAGAALDPPLPGGWTPTEYATWSARLVGLPREDARARAARAFEALGVHETSVKLAKAPLALKRATVLAAAMATGAPVVAFEDPSESLDDETANALARLVVDALAEESRDWIVFAARALVDSPIVRAAGEAIVVAGSDVVAQGAPSELAARTMRYAIDARGSRDASDALAAKLGARARVEHASIAADGARFVVELTSGMTTRDLFAFAEECGAVVLELRPVWP